MNRAIWILLVGIVAAVAALLVGSSLYLKTHQELECRDIIADIAEERTDIVVSDRVPMGCFIPPDISSESAFNTFKDKIKEENKILWDHCFNLGDGEVTWELVEDNLKHGIKVNGYCYDCEQPHCLCLKENLTGRGLSSRRSLNFIETAQYEKCIPPGKSPFANISELPSVFVVKQGEEVNLSLYGGVKLTGKKRLVGAKGALYNGTTRISSYTDPNQICTSCFFGEEWNCYETERDEDDCECHVNRRCYDESAVEMCKNYCKMELCDNIESCSFCKSGCEIGNSRYEYRNCYSLMPNKTMCDKKADCDGESDEPEIDCEGFLEKDICFDLDDDERTGCKKFLEFEDSVFEIGPMNYTVFKIGDVEMLPGYENYRGLAHAEVNLTIQGKFPGKSCYNINNYECYFDCCKKVCADEGCDDKNCNDIPTGDSVSECEKRCHCSTSSRVVRSDPFVLCRTFCASKDAFFENLTKIRYCQRGCEDAATGETIHAPPLSSDFEEGCTDEICDSGEDNWTKTAEIKSYPPGFFGGSKSVGIFDTRDDVPGDSSNEEWKVGNITKTVNLSDYDLLYIPYKLFAQGLYSKASGVPVPYNSKIKVYIDGSEVNDMNDEHSTETCCGLYSDEGLSKEGTFEIDVSDPSYSGEHEIKIEMKISKSEDLVGIAPEDLVCDCGITDNHKEPSAGVFVDNIMFVKGGALGEDIEDIEEYKELYKSYFEGYEKYFELNNSVVGSEDPYIYRNLYKNVYSNLIYILNWSSPGANWTYPYHSNWGKLKTPGLNKKINLNAALKIIKDIYIKLIVA